MALKQKSLIDEKEKYRSNLEAIFRSVSDSIITVNKELRIIELNDAAEKICGSSREKAINKKLSFPKKTLRDYIY